MTALVVQQVNKLAGLFGIPESGELIKVLKSTAFKGDVSDAQMSALLIVANQYKLNPWTKEIYAFPDKNNGIVPVVGVDGWARIINEHPMFDGMEFSEGDIDAKSQLPGWIECVIFRKDRGHPIKVREYMVECKRGTGPWQSHPRRMLRHKSMIQCARLAFGFTGFYDEDEAARILDIDAEGNVVPGQQPNAGNTQGNGFMPKTKPAEGTTQQRQADDARTIDVEAKEKPTSDKNAEPASSRPEQAQQAQQQNSASSDEPKLTEGMITTIRNKMKNSGKTDEAFAEEYAMRLEEAPRSMVNSILKWASV